ETVLSPLQGFTNARVVDGLGGAVERATVQIRDGRISGIDPARGEAPAGKGWIDLAGRTLIPGLVDAHVHLSSYPEALGLPAVRRGELAPPRELRYFAL